MVWLLSSLWDKFPLPILIGIIIWTFSMFFFIVLLFILIFLLKQRSKSITELISIKEVSNVETIRKGKISLDSLSLISSEPTQTNSENAISSFYLNKCYNLKEQERLHSLPSIKLRPIINDDKHSNTLPQSTTRRSIIRDLASVSVSFNDKKFHHSIDSLFSKDSLIE